MSTISRLFFSSPISLLCDHFEKVIECAGKVKELFNALTNEEYEKIVKLKVEISELENAADKIKNKIRNEFIKKRLFSIDKNTFFEILSIQDGIADKCEDLGVLLNLRKLKILPEMKENLELMVGKNVECVEITKKILKYFDELTLTSFGGKDVEIIKELVEEVAFKEHEADEFQSEVLKVLFKAENELKYTEFFLWVQTLKTLADLSNYSEKLANRIRMILE